MSSRRRSKSKRSKKNKFRSVSRSRPRSGSNSRSRSRSRRLKYKTVSSLLLGAHRISPQQAMSIYYGPRTSSRLPRLPQLPGYSDSFYAHRR